MMNSSFPFLRFATEHGLPYSNVLRATEAIKSVNYAETIRHIPAEAAPALLKVFNDEQMRRRDVRAREQILKRIVEGDVQ